MDFLAFLSSKEAIEFYAGFICGLILGGGGLGYFLLKTIKMQIKLIELKDKEIQTLKENHKSEIERLNKNFFDILRGIIK